MVSEGNKIRLKINGNETKLMKFGINKQRTGYRLDII